MLGYLADDVCDLREGARSVVAVLLKSADHTRKLAFTDSGGLAGHGSSSSRQPC